MHDHIPRMTVSYRALCRKPCSKFSGNARMPVKLCFVQLSEIASSSAKGLSACNTACRRQSSSYSQVAFTRLTGCQLSGLRFGHRVVVFVLLWPRRGACTIRSSLGLKGMLRVQCLLLLGIADGKFYCFLTGDAFDFKRPRTWLG